MAVYAQELLTKTLNRQSGQSYYKTPIIDNFQNVRQVVIPTGTPVDDFARLILAGKLAEEKITVLALHAHGDFGQVYLGGENYMPLVGALLDSFSILKPHLNPPYGKIEIHACGVASSTTILKGGTVGNPITQPGTLSGNDGIGYKFLAKFAKLMNLGVFGQINAGWDSTKMPSPSIWVYPDGGYLRM